MTIERRLGRLAAGPDRSAKAARALVDRASEAGLVDVAVATMGSPIGELLVAVTRRGLARVAFEDEGRDLVLDRLVRELSPRILEAPRLTDRVRTELEEYFAGRRHGFDIALDRRLIGPFARAVLRATGRVGFGRTATYGQIAARIGRPTAPRAVGRALGSNPIPVVIPCHRIVGASGALTGYAGGVDRKRVLLLLEGVPLAGSGVPRVTDRLPDG